jgi:uncharacterized protein
MMFRLMLAVLLLLITGCSREPQAVVVDESGKPALWKVSKGKGTAWLFGTVHLLPPDTDWQTPALHRATREADSLVLEVTGLEDQQAVSQIFAHMGISPGQPPLDSRINPALRQTLVRLDDRIPGPPTLLNHMESWAAALTLASAMSADLGLQQESGVERVLTLRFRNDRKPLSGLETIGQQFGFFDQLSEHDQRLMLNAVLRGEKDSRESYKNMLGAWLRGDAEAVFDGGADSILASPTIREALLDGRNRNWARQIGAMIDKGHRPFVAVGAGHMVGQGGVPALLKTAGYHVERIQ